MLQKDQEMKDKCDILNLYRQLFVQYFLYTLAPHKEASLETLGYT